MMVMVIVRPKCKVELFLILVSNDRKGSNVKLTRIDADVD